VPVFKFSLGTVHPSTATVPITVLLYNGPLLCGFNVPVKGLNMSSCWPSIPSSQIKMHGSRIMSVDFGRNWS